MKVYLHYDVSESESLTLIVHVSINTTVSGLLRQFSAAARRAKTTVPRTLFLAPASYEQTPLAFTQSDVLLRSLFVHDRVDNRPFELFVLSTLPASLSASAEPARAASPPEATTVPSSWTMGDRPLVASTWTGAKKSYTGFIPAVCIPAKPPSSSSPPPAPPAQSAESSSSSTTKTLVRFAPSSETGTGGLSLTPVEGGTEIEVGELLERISDHLQTKAWPGSKPSGVKQAQGLCSVCINALSFDEDAKFVQCFRCSTVNLPVDRVAAQAECPGCRSKLFIVQATPVCTCERCNISLVVMECSSCSNPFVYLRGTEKIQCSRCQAEQVETRNLNRTTVHHLINADVNDPPSARFSTDRKIPPTAKPVALIVQYYVDAQPARQKELDEAVANNLLNRWIDKVYFMLERDDDRAVILDKFADKVTEPDKIVIVPYGRRLTYSDAFAFANSRLVGSTVVLANLDIFFDSTLMHLKLPLPPAAPPKLFYTLSRYEVEPDGKVIFKESFAPLSQDAWIFSPPIEQDFVDACNFPLGVPGCDNRIVHECQTVGKRYFVTHNPSLKIVARHLHASNIRNYSQKDAIKGKYAYLPPSFSLWPDSR